MLKQLNYDNLLQLLETISTDYALQVPTLLADGTRLLANYGSGELSLTGPPLQRKPTSAFFPQTELLLTIDVEGQVHLPQPEKPVALFGLDRTDLAALTFLDRFFCAPPADDIYQRKRDRALIISLTGSAGPERSFLPLTEDNCDIEMSAVNGQYLALGHSELGQGFLDGFADGDPQQLEDLRRESAQQVSPAELLQQASRLLSEERVPDRFWKEIADKCILCSGCNLACPTCSCFGVQDRQSGHGTERSRVWDSCQLDAFMREASGHNPLGSEQLRTRRRIHHKLVADVERWGELGCVACGRCDRACPVGIGMLAVAEEIVRRFN
ncbi:4Fe-4S dicluster domain-containing protein [Malonomonas rubra]|uniref:4Fe-4S dicluster domain-containing protein n=1 Tax=Malonomonas rubra TaxID=57040 RepID=UPI0026F01F62|nr:4Fe-4S dicluster domain-containing protein [Malonomonas rubra]